jgi:mRNA-degrading endonuclease HigB of HigAB toxin-antitoxin module
LCSFARYGKLMKVTGRSKLIRLTEGAEGGLRAASRAFYAELENARWRSHSDALSAYPGAVIETHRLIIHLGGQHCVVAAINYESGIALIEYAGSVLDRSRNSPTLGRARK